MQGLVGITATEGSSSARWCMFVPVFRLGERKQNYGDGGGVGLTGPCRFMDVGSLSRVLHQCRRGKLGGFPEPVLVEVAAQCAAG
jgi:hypothetical protein